LRGDDRGGGEAARCGWVPACAGMTGGDASAVTPAKAGVSGQLSIFSAEMNASCGMSTRPN
jgi:hypothetical protein